MPYKSKAERESENWMTLPEAINHFCKIENIPEMKARKQLVAALVDGELWPLRWQRERGDRARPFGRSAVPSPTDAPPRGPDWSGAKIRWKTSRVHDDWGEFKQGQWRMLLIHRHRVINCGLQFNQQNTTIPTPKKWCHLCLANAVEHQKRQNASKMKCGRFSGRKNLPRPTWKK